MKKIILILTVFLSVNLLTAQITITRNDLIVSGQVLIQANDTNVFPVQSAGTNKTWNFAGLKASTKSTQTFNPPQWYPGYMNFPNANLAVIDSDNDSSFTYLKINNTELAVEGGYELVGDSFNVSPYKSTIITFPSTYNTTFSQNLLTPPQSFPFGVDIDSTGPIPFIDSIRFSGDIKFKSTIEGWGSLTTPLGTYNALMQNQRTISGAKLEMYTNNIWLTVNPNLAALLGFGSFQPDTSYEHRFWTNDASVGFPLVSYSFNEGETTTNSIDWLQTKPQANSISSSNKNAFASFYPNPCHSSFNIILPTETSTDLVIYDLNGKVVQIETVVNGSKIDISHLCNGVYTVKYKDNSSGAMLQVQKIIKY